MLRLQATSIEQLSEGMNSRKVILTSLSGSVDRRSSFFLAMSCCFPPLNETDTPNKAFLASFRKSDLRRLVVGFHFIPSFGSLGGISFVFSACVFFLLF